jgi:hypothetical protein
MWPGLLKSWLYYVVRWVGVWKTIGLIVICGVIGLLTPDATYWPNWGVDVHEFLKKNNVWLNPVLGAVAGACIWMGKAIGEPWFWRTVNVIIDDFQRDVFVGLREEKTDDHRVTLYKWAKLCLWPGNRWHWFWPWGRGNSPWSGWLKPTVRSGVYRRGRTIFLAKKVNQDSAEGVAGKAFFSHGVVEITELPDIQKSSQETNDNTIVEYAKRTFVTPEWLSRRLAVGAPIARSFCAIPIEVKKARWGVVMIDSRVATIPAPQKTMHIFKFVGKTLGRLLERA